MPSRRSRRCALLPPQHPLLLLLPPWLSSRSAPIAHAWRTSCRSRSIHPPSWRCTTRATTTTTTTAMELRSTDNPACTALLPLDSIPRHRPVNAATIGRRTDADSGQSPRPNNGDETYVLRLPPVAPPPSPERYSDRRQGQSDVIPIRFRYPPPGAVAVPEVGHTVDCHVCRGRLVFVVHYVFVVVVVVVVFVSMMRRSSSIETSRIFGYSIGLYTYSGLSSSLGRILVVPAGGRRIAPPPPPPPGGNDYHATPIRYQGELVHRAVRALAAALTVEDVGHDVVGAINRKMCSRCRCRRWRIVSG